MNSHPRAVLIANKYPLPVDDGKKVFLTGVLRYLIDRCGPENVLFVVVSRAVDGPKPELSCETLWIEPPPVSRKLWNALWHSLVRGRKTIQESMLYSPRVGKQLETVVAGFHPHLLFCDMLRVGQFFGRAERDHFEALFIDELLSLRLDGVLSIAGRLRNVDFNPLGSFHEFVPRTLHRLLQVGPVYRTFFRLEASLTRRRELESPSHHDLCLLANPNETRSLSGWTGAGNVASLKPLLRPAPRAERDYDGKPIFVLLGTLFNIAHRMSVAAFLETEFEEIVERIPQVRLEIIGTGGDQKILEIAGRYSSHLSLLGFVPDLGQHLRSACALLAPMMFPGGLKLKTLTALSYGLPVVTTEWGADGLPLQHGYDCLIAELPDFVTQMESLLEPVFNRTVSENCRRTFETHFSAVAVFQEYDALFQGALASPHR